MRIPCLHPALRAVLALAACALPAHSAFALVKCVGNDGRVTFQDVQCGVDSTSVTVLKRFGQSADKPTQEATPRAAAEPALRSAAARPVFGSTSMAASSRLR